MSLGNGNPKEGDKGSNFNYELKVLQGLEAIAVALESGSNYVEILYQDLRQLYYDGNLKPGTFYAITDYQMVYDTPRYNILGGICDAAYINTQYGPIEVLIVQALAPNALAPQAYLPGAPNIYIEYDITYGATIVKNAPAKGRITRYIDHWYNNVSAYYDPRYIIYDRFREYISDGINNIAGTNFEINLDTGTLTCLDGNALFTSQLNIETIIYTGVGKINVFITSILDDNTLNFLTEPGITTTITSPGPLYNTVNTDVASATETYVGQVIHEGAITSYYCMLLDDVGLNIELGPSGNTNGFLLDNNIIGGPRTARNVILGGNCTNNTIIGYVNGFSLESGSSGNYFGYADGNLNNIKFNLQSSGNVFYGNMDTCTLDKCEDNRVIGDFLYNTIQGSFLRNTIEGPFQSTTVSCGDFSDNLIKGAFTDNNIICNAFINNIFGGNVTQCTVNGVFDGNSALKNIDNCSFRQFNNNIIGGGKLAYAFFKCPVEGIDFSSATKIFQPWTKTIELKADTTLILWYVDVSNVATYSAIDA